MALFVNPPGAGQVIGPDRWQTLGRAAQSDRMASGGTVTVLPAGMRIGAFLAWVGGFAARSDANIDLTSAPNASGSPRIDRAVVRVVIGSETNPALTTVTLSTAVKQGTPAASPVIPAVTQTTGLGSTWEMSLGWWLMPAGATNATTVTVDYPKDPGVEALGKANYALGQLLSTDALARDAHELAQTFGNRLAFGRFIGQPDALTATCGIVHGLGAGARIVVTPVDDGNLPQSRIVRFHQVSQDETTAQFVCYRADQTGQVPFASNVVGFNWIAVA